MVQAMIRCAALVLGLAGLAGCEARGYADECICGAHDDPYEVDFDGRVLPSVAVRYDVDRPGAESRIRVTEVLSGSGLEVGEVLRVDRWVVAERPAAVALRLRDEYATRGLDGGAVELDGRYFAIRLPYFLPCPERSPYPGPPELPDEVEMATIAASDDCRSRLRARDPRWGYSWER